MDFKICTKCKEKKSIKEFFNDKTKKDGFYSSCKSCVLKYHKTTNALANKRRWRKNNKLAAVKGNLKHNFNLTLEQYDKMFEQQDGVCKICGGINYSGRRLGVDHNHKTGRIRGLLCAKCNTSLGILEDKEFIKKAKQYLKGYSD